MQRNQKTNKMTKEEFINKHFNLSDCVADKKYRDKLKAVLRDYAKTINTKKDEKRN